MPTSMKTLVLFFSTTLAMCSSPNEKLNFGDVAPEFEVADASYDMAPQESMEMITQPIEKKVVKTGNLSFESQDLEKDYQLIMSLCKQMGGYVDYENHENNDYQKSYDMNIKVPAANYDSLIKKISSNVWRLQTMNTHLEDVTMRYYDLQARIENQKALETRYRELLKKATTVSEMLEIERNLNTVQQEIEIQTGKFKYLSGQISHSALQIRFYQRLQTDVAAYDDSFLTRIGNALKHGWRGFLSFIVSIVYGWPYFLVLIALIFGIRKWRKRAKATSQDS